MTESQHQASNKPGVGDQPDPQQAQGKPVPERTSDQSESLSPPLRMPIITSVTSEEGWPRNITLSPPPYSSSRANTGKYIFQVFLKIHYIGIKVDSELCSLTYDIK